MTTSSVGKLLLYMAAIASPFVAYADDRITGGPLPEGWFIPEQAKTTRVEVMEEDGIPFLRVVSSDQRALGYRIPVAEDEGRIHIELNFRVLELEPEGDEQGRMALFLSGRDKYGKSVANWDCGGFSDLSLDWSAHPYDIKLNPREAARVVLTGLENVNSGTYDIMSDIPVQVIEKRIKQDDLAPEFTVRDGLPNFAKKLADAEHVKIAYLGGSITAQNGYRPQTLAWFQEQYPKAQVDQIPAAIGGTGSELGVFRVEQDVIAHKPDLVFIEFAVNDATVPTQQVRQTMEGIVRKIWKADSSTDICFVYTVMVHDGFLDDLATGHYPNAARAMEDVANHYGIPSIHMGVEVARMEREGLLYIQKPGEKAEREEALAKGIYYFSADGVHPHEDTGHVLYTAAVQRGMKEILPAGKPGPRDSLKPLDPENWEDAYMIPFGDAAELKGDWLLLPPGHPAVERFSSRFPRIWEASAGASARIRFQGRYLAVFDLLSSTSGRIKIQTDGQPPKVLDRFSQYVAHEPTGRISMVQIVEQLDPSILTTVDIEVEDFSLEDKRAVIKKHYAADTGLVNMNATEFQERFGGNRFMPGMLLVRGTLNPQP